MHRYSRKCDGVAGRAGCTRHTKSNVETRDAWPAGRQVVRRGGFARNQAISAFAAASAPYASAEVGEAGTSGVWHSLPWCGTGSGVVAMIELRGCGGGFAPHGGFSLILIDAKGI